MPEDSYHGLIEPDFPFLLGLYQELHAHPELSGQEEWTAARIASELGAAGFPSPAVSAGTGLSASFPGVTAPS